MKIGSIEWTNERLYIRWQAIRLDDEYRAFCDKYSQYFNTDGMLEIWRLPAGERLPTGEDEVEREIKEVQGRWGLDTDTIYHYNVDHDIDYFIDDNVFENPFAIDFLLKDEKSEDLDPFWGKNHIVLKVNVDGSIPDAQLKDEFLEYIQAARESIGIKQVRSTPDEVDLQVYKLFKDGWASREIIKEVWPDEYKIEFGKDEPGDEYEQGKLYKKLSKEYQKQGLRDWDVRAFAEAYPKDACEADHTDKSKSGRIRLYVRVRDAIKRVEKYMERIKI